MKATHLQVEYLTEPLGIGNARPRFFWQAKGGIRQTAYRIVCMRGKETVWDSGRVESSAMTHIRYDGKDLSSRDSITWTVRLWDENGEAAEISESRFELGLLEKEDWCAKWISGDYKPKKNIRYPSDCFRKEFAAVKPVAKARLYATARGIYDVSINGRRIEDFILAPGMTDYRRRIQVQTYNVTALLKEQNVIEMRLGDGWYRGSSAAYGVTNVYGSRTSLLAQLEITFADGSVEKICSDSTWQWSNDGPVRFNDLKDGEVYDASMKPGYGGKAAEVPAPKDVMLVNSDNVAVSEHERFTPVLINSEDGVQVLDFGQNLAGYLQFSLKGRKGQRLRFICSEVLDEKGHADLLGVQELKPADGWSKTALIQKLAMNRMKGKTVCTPLQEIVFFCSGKEDTYKTSFAFFGFRYVEIVGDIEIDPKKFTAIAVYSDMEQTGDFSCSDSRINQLVSNTRWSMKGNYLDLPMDCPTRERLGWTGDAQIFFDTGTYFMNTAPFFAKWLRDMEDAQYKNGLIPAVLPYQGVEMMYRATGSSVGWADAVYLIPWRYFNCYRDEEVLRRCWPMMKKYAKYLFANIEKDGHYEKGVHLGEWLEPEEFRDTLYGVQAKHPEECTAYLYLTMKTMAQIADFFGETDYADRLRDVAVKAKMAYPAYAQLDTNRQAKLVRPLAFGLLDGKDLSEAQKRLKKAVENYGYRVGTGFLSTPFILSVLSEAGESETAYRMLVNTEKPGWLAEIEEGATTVWESWEGDASHNHYSPGSVCRWLFDTCAGIRSDKENHFIIAPVPGGGLSFAGASWKSLYGEVISRWEKKDGVTSFHVEIPANCTATLCLTDGSEHQLSAGSYDFTVATEAERSQV